MKGNCFIDIEEERQKIKDLLFILEKFNVKESAYRGLTVFCEGLPRLESEIIQYIKYHVNPETNKIKIKISGGRVKS